MIRTAAPIDKAPPVARVRPNHLRLVPAPRRRRYRRVPAGVLAVRATFLALCCSCLWLLIWAGAAVAYGQRGETLALVGTGCGGAALLVHLATERGMRR